MLVCDVRVTSSSTEFLFSTRSHTKMFLVVTCDEVASTIFTCGEVTHKSFVYTCMWRVRVHNFCFRWGLVQKFYCLEIVCGEFVHTIFVCGDVDKKITYVYIYVWWVHTHKFWLLLHVIHNFCMWRGSIVHTFFCVCGEVTGHTQNLPVMSSFVHLLEYLSRFVEMSFQHETCQHKRIRARLVRNEGFIPNQITPPRWLRRGSLVVENINRGIWLTELR